MALYIPDVKALFIHIPKTGGISIRHALMGLYGNTAQEIGKTHCSLSDVKSLNQLMMPVFIFSVVRNPYDWAISLYNFIKRSNEHPAHSFVKYLSFDDFIKWLIENIEIQSETVFGKYMIQTQYLQYSLEFPLSKILRFEKLNEDWRNLANLMRWPPTLRHINESLEDHNRLLYFNKTQTMDIFQQSFHSDFINFNYSKEIHDR